MSINQENLEILSRSYALSLEKYNASLKDPTIPQWDYIALTASNELQKKSFEVQIERRQKLGLLPTKTKFIVIPDKDGKRVGSGGATLSVIKYIKEENKTLSNLKILVIHSGGDSKRIPQYSAIGKLFSPIPRELPIDNGKFILRNSTLFDELIISMHEICQKINEGMLILSGDVLLVFDLEKGDFNGEQGGCLAFKEKPETGQNFGVYISNNEGYVEKCLQKKLLEILKKDGAIDENGMINIDTGAVFFNKEILDNLYSMVDTDEKYEKTVNDTVRLSLYADFLYPFALKSTLENFYEEKPEGEMNDELLKARKIVWEKLHNFNLKIFEFDNAKFIHIGNTYEVLDMENLNYEKYRFLNWEKNTGCSFIFDKMSGYNSLINKNSKIGTNCYIENSEIQENANIGNNCIVSFMKITDEKIPDNVVVHGIKLLNGNYVVRIYGVNDNPKENYLFSIDIGEPLWSAKIYKEEKTLKTALESSLNLYKEIQSTHSIKKSNDLLSLADGFNKADPYSIINWENELTEIIKMEKILNLINEKKPATLAPEILNSDFLTEKQKKWLDEKIKNSDFSTIIRLYLYIGTALGEENGEEYMKLCFKEIQLRITKESLSGNIQYHDNYKIQKNKVQVNLPLRVNLGGGWSDTPPYCNENGGTVINMAVLLNGEMPVEVIIEKIDNLKIIIESIDIKAYKEFDNIADLQDVGDPKDHFGISKTALIILGIIPQNDGNLIEILKRLGSGFKITTNVKDVPTGNGLGTSSILSAAVVKCLYEFLGIKFNDSDVYQSVLLMEQLMNTGGGWQDQVGGATNGVKLITSEKGLCQKLNVEHLNVDLKKFNERFCLIYSGEARLAQNILRQVLGRYLGNAPEMLHVLNEIKVVAVKMKECLIKGDFDEFAKLYDSHYGLSLKIYAGSQNENIKNIFEILNDLIDSRMVCGAGGGGFIAVMLKKGVTREDLRKKLRILSPDGKFDVWDSTIV